jgi:hypothetical protein
MKKLALLPLLLLAGCFDEGHKVESTGLGYQAQIPELPPELAIKAKALEPITDATMGGTQIQGAKDDMQYNSVAHQNNALIDIYNCVRNAVNNKGEDLKKCLQ